MMPNPILRRLLKLSFHHLYHVLAWTYDFVSGVVSLGHWSTWIDSVLAYVRGPAMLELGHGTGRLQQSLAGIHGLTVVGLDESRQMGMLARRRFLRRGWPQPRLVRALAQNLPFSNGTFSSVVSTFPTEFVFDQGSLSETWRVLRPSGRLVVLPTAWIVGQHAMERAVAWLLQATGQAPPRAVSAIADRLCTRLRQAGFHTESRYIHVDSGVVLVVVADK